MIIKPKDALKKECRNFGGPLLANGVGGPRIVGWNIPLCSGDRCMQWRWSAEHANHGYCGRSGLPTSSFIEFIEETPEEAPCPPLKIAN